MGEVTRSESYRLENRNRTPDDSSGNQTKDAVRQESFRIQNVDMTRSESFMMQNREGETSFMTQNDGNHEEDLAEGNVKSDPGSHPGPTYTVGTIQDRKANLGYPHESGSRPEHRVIYQTVDEVDMVAMHNLSMELAKIKDNSFDDANRQRRSASEPFGVSHSRNSMDGQQNSPGFNQNQPYDNRLGPQGGQHNNERGAYFHGNQMNVHSGNVNFRHNDGQNVLQHRGVPHQEHSREGLYHDRFPFSRPEQQTSFDGSSSLSSDNLPKLGDPFQDLMFDNGLPNIRDFEFSGSEFSSRSVTPPLPPLSPSNTPPRTPPLLHSPRGGLPTPRTKMVSPRQNTPSSRFPPGARKTPDLLSNMDKFPEEIFIDGPGVNNQISITPPGSPHGKYKVWNNPYPPGRVSLPSPKQRRKKRAPKSGKLFAICELILSY
jgi:hypothetical protein